MATRLSDEVPTAALRRALHARDVDAFLASCGDDVVLHSPLTERATFQGSDVPVALRALFATLADIEYLADVGEDATRALFATANVNGGRTEKAIRIELAIRVELEDQGKVREVTFFARPLPGLAALALGAGPRIAHAFGGGVASWLARIQLAPIAIE